jgi:hypothetical protein
MFRPRGKFFFPRKQLILKLAASICPNGDKARKAL